MSHQQSFNKLKINGYEHISDIVNHTNQRLADIREGLIKPILTKSDKETEKIGGYFPTDQVTIAARTGAGKTAYILNLMGDFINPELNPHYSEKVIILYDSWEMPSWRNMLRLYSRENKKTVKELLDYNKAMTDEAFQRIISISQKFKNQPIYMSSISTSPKEWYDNKRRIQDANPNMTIINVVDHTRLVTKTTEKSEEELITSFMKIGMKAKLEMEQLNFFLSQMNRAIETSGKREDMGKATPVSSDIFGADSVYQCSDVVLALHRPGMYGLTEWEGIATGKQIGTDASDNLFIECLLKQRDGWTGNILRYHNLAHNEFYDTLPASMGGSAFVKEVQQGMFGTQF